MSSRFKGSLNHSTAVTEVTWCWITWYDDYTVYHHFIVIVAELRLRGNDRNSKDCLVEAVLCLKKGGTVRLKNDSFTALIWLIHTPRLNHIQTFRKIKQTRMRIHIIPELFGIVSKAISSRIRAFTLFTEANIRCSSGSNFSIMIMAFSAWSLQKKKSEVHKKRTTTGYLS